MWVKVVVHAYEDGVQFVPSQTPIEMRDSLAEIWIKNGWAVQLPDPNAPAEIAPEEVIQTPEDGLESNDRETAVMRRRSRK